MSLTLAQRRGFLIVLASAITIGAYQLMSRPVMLAYPLPDVGDRASELQSRIDPNIATQAELSVLPMFGEKRARDVVEFREQSGLPRPFATANDLMKIKGIGPGILRQIEPFLEFETATPGTRPAH